ncbi:hypothetical protein [Anaeromyxobacter sp. PSR-1]|uniref:hypothetical protein n=1 Tax=Anaeromyxobacter sp. PSR-1 TaxID=1300915 RepID=UPI0007509B70|nr:hypothetical protein [Anaeromyxobacter sp. PSR-1]
MRPCLAPNCPALVHPPENRCPRHRAEADARWARRVEAHRDGQGWRAFYRTDAWRRRRAEQLAREPTCRSCGTDRRLQAAHVGATPKEWEAFIAGPLQTLCIECHARSRAAENWRGGR